jgi:hypothetical protein
MFARPKASRAPAVLLRSFAVNGMIAFLVILAMIRPRLLFESFLPAE